MVDHLTKQPHLVPCRTDVDAKALAKVFLEWIFRLYGLPKTIVSDRGPQFTSVFWGELCRCLGIDRRMSTAFHPQTDGQTERMNAVMEQYLRSYVNYLQDDWNEWLPVAEFAANNQASETTKVSPFFGLYGSDPLWGVDLATPTTRPNESTRDAHASAQALDEIHQHLRSEMRRAQEIQAEAADRRRLPAPTYQPGDRVWLNAKNIKTRRPAAKLDHRRLGPFEVQSSVGSSAVRLILPPLV